MTDAGRGTQGTPGGASFGPRSGPDTLTLAAFAALVVLIAANVVAIRFTNRELPPLWGAGTRFGLAAALFSGYVLARRLPLPRGRALVLGGVYVGALARGKSAR